MKIRNDNCWNLEGSDGETLTVQVFPVHGKAEVIFNGKRLDQSHVVLDSAAGSPNVLAVACVYTEQRRGSCKVVLAGDQEGRFELTLSQTPDETMDRAAFFFYLS